MIHGQHSAFSKIGKRSYLINDPYIYRCFSALHHVDSFVGQIPPPPLPPNWCGKNKIKPCPFCKASIFVLDSFVVNPPPPRNWCGKIKLNHAHFVKLQSLSELRAPKSLHFLSPMERENTTAIVARTPLLQINGPHQQTHHNHNRNQQQRQQEMTVVGVDGEDDETLLDKTLQLLDFRLSLLGFNQTSLLSFGLSWFAFLLVGVAVPVLIFELTHCSSCEDYKVNDFEYDVLTSQALLGALSLISVSHNLRKRGIRKFLFVDRYKGHTSQFMVQYIKKIKDSYHLLFWSLLPCCFLKLTHEIIRTIYVQNQPWWQAGLTIAALVMSWTYLSAITLVACVLFHLACSLQVIHFNDYGKLLERESNILGLIDEHVRLRHYLSKISHRFRIYLLLIFLIVTSALFVTLVQTTSAIKKITFLNGGNFAVVETLLCLHAGTKISSKAQGIGALACKWHAVATCRPFEGARRINSAESVNRSISMGSLTSNYSDSDLESLNGLLMPTQTQLATVSSYNQRQSFLMYLQTNPGGITLYGWTVDRSLLTTIFFIELSLVLFVLGQTVIFTPTATLT